MEITTISNIILSALSFLLAFISIVFVIVTLKQNNRMLEASSRPYISIYLETITICEQTTFFVIKNFGTTPALITKFEYDPILKTTPQKHNLYNLQFDYIRELTISPGQSKLMPYDTQKLSNPNLTFVIGYISQDEKYYEDSVTVNAKNYSHIPVPRPETGVSPDNLREVNTLREILEHLI